jgi:cell division protein FtsB
MQKQTISYHADQFLRFEKQCQSQMPSQKTKMAANNGKNKICVRRHLELSQKCFYFYIASELQHIKKLVVEL